MHTELTFGFSTTPPTVDELTVYKSLKTPFLGAPFKFMIIGSSHYIAAPTCSYHEISSCKRIENDDGDIYELSLNDPSTPDREFSFETDHVAVTTHVEHRTLDTFDPDDHYDLCHKFGPEAYTAITLDETAYETYHTYPEYDCTLYTHTVFNSSPTQSVSSLRTRELSEPLF